MGSNCQVDFYVLQSEGQSPEQVACWLALKAWEQGHRVAIRAAGPGDARALDEMMWDFPEKRFLPHEIGTSSTAPVVIGTADQPISDDRPVVINLAESPVADSSGLQRLLEIVPANDQHRLASREKFRHYRQQGLEPDSHPLNTQ